MENLFIGVGCWGGITMVGDGINIISIIFFV